MILLKILTAAELFAMALEVGYTKPDARRITCIARYESDFKTYAVNKNIITQDHGILQINDVWLDTPGKGCFGLNPYNVYESLICAKRIVKQQGWNAWVAYNKNKTECDR